MTEKIKILFMAANPADSRYRIFLDQQVREIEQMIQLGVNRDTFELISEWVVSLDDLHKALLKHMPTIVHFSGHGRDNRGIILEDDGNTKLVSKQTLASLFSPFKDTLRIVVLHASYSKSQADALQSTIDFTIRMSTTIGNRAGVVFFAYFYQALFFGRSVPTAFELAKNQLELEGLPESQTPELLVRKGVNISHRFLVSVKKSRSSRATPSSKKKPTKLKSKKPKRLLQVFLCHSKGDKLAVRSLYKRLQADGIDPWLDEENIMPGQDWEFEITKAVRNSHAVLVCLSSSAIKKTGYIQKEIGFALDVADKQPEGTIFLIPVRLEECEVPERLSRWQWVDLFDERGYSRLMFALMMRAEGINITVRPSA